MNRVTTWLFASFAFVVVTATQAATAPGAPTIGTATPGNAKATVTFTPPTSNGGSAITRYTVTSTPGAKTASGTVSPITVTGLTNGTAYTFKVTARNAIGTGPASAASNSVVPATIPGAPTIGVATAGNAQATVNFTAPTNNGGSAITGYTVASSPAGGVDNNAGTTGLGHVITGLANGTAYTFTVTATNAMGTSAASAASNSVTPTAPATVPGVPTIGTATAGNAQATVTFAAPANNGGSAITGYTVTSSPAGGVDSNAGATGLSHLITGLTNGTTYTFTVTATNAVGTSAASTASNSVTPMAPTVPGVPTIGTATAGNAQATVTFTAPASNGGSPILGYIATSNPGGLTGSGSASPIVVMGLANGTVYTFTVTASNVIGTSLASAPSNSVTPTAPATAPGAPSITNAIGGNGTASVTFAAPASNGGSPITGYTVTSNPAGGTDSNAGATALTHLVTGLANGTAYTFTVTATNAVGTGAASTTSLPVTPAPTVPGTPTIGTATAGNGQATVGFSAPASNGGAAITTYTATSNPGGWTGRGMASPLTVTGLSNGTAYTFTVTATNAVGTSPPSASSLAVTPMATVPGAPTIGTATAASGQASVAFTAPGSNGGSVITGYTVTAAPGGQTGTGISSPITVTGLANGTAYTFTVTASNAVGASLPSAATLPVTPAATVSSAPTITSATPSNGRVTVTFTAPTSNGGSVITGYTVASNPAGGTDSNAGSTALSHVVTGLANGTSYTFTVSASNAVGQGPASAASNTTTPQVPTPVAGTAVQYVYDELGRLAGAIDTTGNAVGYHYDAVGNLTSIDGKGSVSIIDFAPNSGPVGTSVTLYGSGFAATAAQNTVNFNGVAATVTSVATDQLTVTVPAGATTGLITVTTPAGTATSASSFVVESTQVPAITSFTPNIGSAGTAVTLTGTNFEVLAANNRVAFGLRDAMVGSNTTTTIHTTVPASAGSGKIAVQTRDGIAVSAADFYALPGTATPTMVGFTGRLAVNGSAVNIATSATAPLGVVLVDIAAGQAVSLVGTANTYAGAVAVQVYSPNGLLTDSQTLSGVSNTLALNPTHLSGTYTIILTPAAGPGVVQLSATTSPIVSGTSTTAFTIDVNPVREKQPVHFKATVLGRNPTGTVTFYDGASTRLAEATVDASGVAEAMTSNLAIGVYHVTALYSGDAANASSTSAPTDLIVYVGAATTIIPTAGYPNPNPVIVGRPVDLHMHVSGSNPGGSVVFSDGIVVVGRAHVSKSLPVLPSYFAPIYYVTNYAGGLPTATGANTIGAVAQSPVSNPTPVPNPGDAWVSFVPTTVGNRKITATYSGDVDNRPSSVDIGLTVQDRTTPTLTFASPASNSVFVGQSVTYTVSISGTSPTGIVKFMDGALELGRASVTQVVPSGWTSSPRALGTYTGTSYSGPVAIASPVYVTGGVTPTPSPCPEVVSGYCASITVTAPLTTGARQVDAVYSGDASNMASVVSFPFTVNAKTVPTITWVAGKPSPNPVVVGQSVSYAVTVTGTAPSGTVTFSDGATVLGISTLTPTNLGGTGGCTGQSYNYCAYLTVPATLVGARTITATYSGDVSNTSGSANAALTVNPQTVPTVSWVVGKPSPNPVVVGQSVSYAVTVTGTAPSGTVTFSDGATVLGTSTLAYVSNTGGCPATSSYCAYLTVPATLVGARTITATYSGNASNTSGSANAALTVNPQTVPTVTWKAGFPSPNPVIIGLTATYVATVTGTNPTGTVTFYDGTTVLGTSTVAATSGSGPCLGSNWCASLAVPATFLGARQITATYSGDASNNAASATTTLTVNPQTVPTLTWPTGLPRPNPVTVGQTVSYAVLVAGTTPTGTVSFNDGSTFLGTGTLAYSNTTGPCAPYLNCASITVPATMTGIRTITATYSGDIRNQSVSASTSLTVNSQTAATVNWVVGYPISPIVVGTYSSFRVAVSGTNPTGTVSFSDGSTMLGSGIVTGGIAFLNSVQMTQVGVRAITATYSGDASNLAASATATMTVSDRVPTTIIWVPGYPSPNPATLVPPGLTVALKTNVLGNNVTGTVTYSEGATVLGSVQNPAILPLFYVSVAQLGAGVHTITATYSGDISNQPSSASTTLTVQ